MECPNCGSSNLQKKGTRAGKQRYRCNDCKANFTEGIPYKKQVSLPPLKGITCPKCNSTSVVRDGKLLDGTQRFRCRACKLDFSSKTVKPIKRMKPEEKEIIIQAVLAGKNVNKITEEYECTHEYIKDLLRPHYASETITPEQKKDIIKYGYYLRVPVDYMAEYIKCSEHKCEEVLKKFKKSLMSTNRDAI